MNNVTCFFCNKEIEKPENKDPEICSHCWLEGEKMHAIKRVWQARQELNDSVKAILKVKYKDELLMIASVFKFPNGMVLVCDQYGEQMPEYQGYWAEKKEAIEAQIDKQTLKPVLHE